MRKYAVKSAHFARNIAYTVRRIWVLDAVRLISRSRAGAFSVRFLGRHVGIYRTIISSWKF